MLQSQSLRVLVMLFCSVLSDWKLWQQVLSVYSVDRKAHHTWRVATDSSAKLIAVKATAFANTLFRVLHLVLGSVLSQTTILWQLFILSSSNYATKPSRNIPCNNYDHYRCGFGIYVLHIHSSVLISPTLHPLPLLVARITATDDRTIEQSMT